MTNSDQFTTVCIRLTRENDTRHYDKVTNFLIYVKKLSRKTCSHHWHSYINGILMTSL